VAGTPMRAWDQAAGGELTDQQVNDLVTLILSWEKTPHHGS
jgi:hypothetical protein